MQSDIHWPEILSEFFGTALMVGWGLSSIAFFWSDSSPAPQLVANESLRRFVTGFFFAGGAAVVVYSPLGERSGGHINPSITLAFLSLKKILPKDAFFYVLAQTLGGFFGAYISYLLFTQLIGWPDAIIKGVTSPGPGYSTQTVFLAEMFITFSLMLTILIVSNIRKVMKLTALCASTVVALEVWMEAPVSGASLNIARSIGPAFLSGRWDDLWIYILAPALGAVIAAQIYVRAGLPREIVCSKLYHTKRFKCIMPGCSFGENSETVASK